MDEKKRFQYGKANSIVGSAPCYGCADREAGCHGKCDRYKEYKELHDAVRQNVIMESLGKPGVPDIRKRVYDRYALQKMKGRRR